MPGVQILPAPTPDPLAGQNVAAVQEIVKRLGEAETKRQQDLAIKNILDVIISSGSQEQLASAIRFADPQYSTGISGLLQKIGGRFAQTPPIESAVTGALMQTAFKPKKEALSIPQLRAKEAQKTGARPGTAEFEAIAEGPVVAADDLEELQDDLTFWQNVYGKTYEKGMLGGWGEIADPETKKMAEERITQIRKRMIEILEQLSAKTAPTEAGKPPSKPVQPSKPEIRPTEPGQTKRPGDLGVGIGLPRAIEAPEEFRTPPLKGKTKTPRTFEEFDSLFPAPKTNYERPSYLRLKSIWLDLPEEIQDKVTDALHVVGYKAVIGTDDLKPYLEKK